MKHHFIVYALLVAAALLPDIAPAADVPLAPGQGQGWTGITNPQDVINARLELMEHIEELMEPIDTITVKDFTDTQTLRTNAEVISAMLLALPHLFPPTTNLYDPRLDIPKTIALPAIWKDFGTFYKLAAAASKAAEGMATATGKGPLRAASFKLRASCDACHALYLRRYEMPKVLESDYKFDFESALHQ
jgi:cytochrome c556